MKLAKPLFWFSGIVILAGVVILFIFKLNLGIDFTSGTRVDMKADHKITQQSVTNTFR